MKKIFLIILFILSFQFSYWNESFLNDFKIDLQRPSYIEKTWSWSYLCDEGKDECKVNFKLIDLEDKDISKTKYNCEIITDFEIQEFSDNCNPTTIIIPKNSEQKIKFKITEKNNLDNFIEKEINIKNNTIPLSDNFDFTYELQSPSYVDKVDENDLECRWENEECKINFKFITLEKKDISSKYDCEIKTDFELPEFSDNCNPTTIVIPKNTDQIIKIKLFQKNNLENFIEKEIFIDNTIVHYLPNTKIEVQWVITKYKKLWYKNMTCYAYEKCWVNFTSWVSNSSIHYKWDFKNWEKYYWYNPKTIYFKPWFYRIKLVTSNKFWNRKVENFKLTVKQLLRKTEIKDLKNNLEKIVKFKETTFLEIDNQIQITKIFNKTKKSITKKLEIKNIKKHLTIKKIFWKAKKIKLTKKVPVLEVKKLSLWTGTKLSDKEKLLKKNIKLNISFQKKNLKISWKTFPKSKVEIKIWKVKFKTFSNNSWKYVLKINNLVPWKYKIQASAYNNKWTLVARKQSREKIITKKYIAQLNRYKYKKYLSYIKKKRKKIKLKYKKYKVSILSPPKIEIKVNKFNLKIFAINTLITILSLILSSFILIRKKII